MAKYPKDLCYQAFRILQILFILAPIFAGLDKFLFILTDWTIYLSPLVKKLIPMDARTFIMCIGGLEILGAIGVAWRPRIFSYIMAFWILIVIINLLILGNFLEIAFRDAGLLLAAFAFARLAGKYDVQVHD